MNQSNYSEKEQVYCCSDCHIKFENYEDLEAHRKDDCPKIFKTPSPSAVPSDVITKTSRQTQVELLTDHFTSVILSSLESLKLELIRKRVASDAFAKEYKEFLFASITYKEAVEKKRKAFKAYYEDRNREKGLTANTEEEHVVNCHKRPEMLSQAEALLKEEEDAEMRIQRVLSKQKAASEANSRATKRLLTALIEAEKWRDQLKEQSGTSMVQSRTKDASGTEKALMQIQITLVECEKLELEYQDSVNTTMKALLMIREAARNENAIFLMERKNENSETSTSGNQQERLVPDWSQFQQMMDVNTLSVSDDCVSS